MATTKLSKAIVLYMPPEVLNPVGGHEGARCGLCMMYLPDLRACTIVHKEGAKSTEVNDKTGVCGLYVGGRPMSSSAMHKPMPTVPRNVAGYIEGAGPTRCGKCRYFVRGAGYCRKVAGEIDAYGCCNAWESGEPIVVI